MKWPSVFPAPLSPHSERGRTAPRQQGSQLVQGANQLLLAHAGAVGPPDADSLAGRDNGTTNLAGGGGRLQRVGHGLRLLALGGPTLRECGPLYLQLLCCPPPPPSLEGVGGMTQNTRRGPHTDHALTRTWPAGTGRGGCPDGAACGVGPAWGPCSRPGPFWSSCCPSQAGSPGTLR